MVFRPLVGFIGIGLEEKIKSEGQRRGSNGRGWEEREEMENKGGEKLPAD